MGMIGNTPYQGLIAAGNLAPGAVVGHLGFTPANKAGDTLTGNLEVAVQKSIQTGSVRSYRYAVDVNLASPVTLVNSAGVAIQSGDTYKVYRVRIVTTGTGTNTGNVFLARNVDGFGWEVRRVAGNGPDSNNPELIVLNGVPKLRTQHASLYTLEVSVEEFDGQNTGASWSVFGADTGMTVDYDGRITMPYQPSFCVYRASTQNISAGGVIMWDTVRHNIGNGYNTSTGRFTAPVAGTYQFNVVNNTISTAGDMVLRKGGANAVGVEFDPSNSGGWLGLSIPVTLQLALGDYVDVIMSTSITQGVEGFPWNCFSGHLLG